MVIPSFNHARYVQACIESVIEQDYQNIELIIIDDGSLDDSVRKIELMFSECTARFTRFEFRGRSNKGLAFTLNEALEWSKGRYFAAIASDDLLHPNKTSCLVSQIEGEDNVAGIFGGCEFIDESGVPLRQLSPQQTKYSFEDILVYRHCIIAPCQLLRREAVKNVGGYPVGLYIEDWYMWLALTKHGNTLKVIPDSLVGYRQHEFNISKNIVKMYEARKWIVNQFKDHPLQRYSLGQIHATAALEFTCISKAKSAGYLVDAAQSDWRVIINPLFISVFIRLFLPCFLVKKAASAKSWVQMHLGVGGSKW